MYWFKNGVKGEEEYDGGRETKSIVDWVIKKNQPPSTKVTCEVLKEGIEANS